MMLLGMYSQTTRAGFTKLSHWVKAELDLHNLMVYLKRQTSLFELFEGLYTSTTVILKVCSSPINSSSERFENDFFTLKRLQQFYVHP